MVAAPGPLALAPPPRCANAPPRPDPVPAWKRNADVMRGVLRKAAPVTKPPGHVCRREVDVPDLSLAEPRRTRPGNKPPTSFLSTACPPGLQSKRLELSFPPRAPILRAALVGWTPFRTPGMMRCRAAMSLTAMCASRATCSSTRRDDPHAVASQSAIVRRIRSGLICRQRRFV